MSLLDIVYCYVSESIPFPGNISEVIESFEKNGFTAKKLEDQKWKLTRGAGVAMTFDYDSEDLEMNVFLELKSNTLHIRVGNAGFPLEQLLVKKRFIRNSGRYVSEIRSQGN